MEWPSRSPDLTPLDFLLVGAFEGCVIPGETTKYGPHKRMH